jgi:hypothetical protein
MHSAELSSRPNRVSVVVVIYNMAREAPRTLYSLSANYQRDIEPEDLEIIVVDNGSNPAFDGGVLEGLSGNFRLIRLDPAPPSPAHAINVGLAAATGSTIGVMIDGARLVTPGLLHFARAGVGLYPRAVVATLGWYLGYDQQRWGLECGYNKAREDAILSDIAWQEDGYRLFDVSAADETTVDGWFGAICESNALFMNRASWDALGGVDERFDVPGGGFVNLDLMTEALERPGSRLVVLLGEGTFHQLHGGVATNASPRAISAAVSGWREQYTAIRGKVWSPPVKAERTYLGALPRPALARFVRAAIEPAVALPLGAEFDRTQWLSTRSPRPSDPVAAALLELVEGEIGARRFEAAAAAARIARSYAPDEVSIQRSLSVACAWLRGPADIDDIRHLRRGRFFLAQARAHAILDRRGEAEAAFLTALQHEPDLVEAHLGLAYLRMPGDGYHSWLNAFHTTLEPATYLELGVDGGRSLSAAGRRTRAIAVDPDAQIKFPIQAETSLFIETNEAFLSRPDLDRVFAGQQVDLAFISGTHTFSDTLSVFAAGERLCHPGAVILLHNTVPLDEITQRPKRECQFYTGDTWKAVVCLKEVRPDLTIKTIPTAPAGLTVISGLDPKSGVIAERMGDLYGKLSNLDYTDLCERRDELLSIVDNDPDKIMALVTGRLKGEPTRTHFETQAPAMWPSGLGLGSLSPRGSSQ